MRGITSITSAHAGEMVSRRGEPQPARRRVPVALHDATGAQRRGEADDPLHLEEQWVPRGSPRPDGWQTTHTIS